ncbi:hypothetical protein DT019_16240 [Streptomyces sp. SDr-06]|uniref:hypothetical protein n=1 Tax=Streptomyces sp. SDr-06 TaxID=2267702 RepID=UPI000DEABD76|nr:hypothetical protein [Streptomyces sp. SDr-06]RCH67792.1 hypothetical protein DT019_16240 [Streptomyces sp. SDr-06]
MTYEQPLREPDPEAPGPTEAERAGREAVRRLAQGMGHHEAAQAFRLLAAAPDSPSEDEPDGPAARHDGGRRWAELAEWERIVGQLSLHAGTYDVASDPYVQGERAAH